MRIASALVNLVSRVPVRVEVKLLAAFLAIEILLIVMGAVGLEVLSGVNLRTDELIKLQRKIEAYRQVQHDTTSQLYGVSSALLSSDDLTLTGALRQLNQFGYDVDRLQFVAKDEVDLLDRFRQDYDRFTNVVTDVVELIRTGRAAQAREMQAAQATPLADRLERLTNQLVNKAEADMVTGIEASNQAYVNSQWTVTGFALGSIMLAVILGYIISRSLITPLTAVETRLTQIAAGDFSQRLNVDNRDELGALATNVNRTSEQLGRLYQQLEAANLAKSRFLAAASHDLRQPLHALNLFVGQLRRETDQAEQARLATRIEACVAAMNELFNALLDISKLDAGVLVPSVSEFPVNDLLGRIETTFMAAAREKGLRLRVVASDAFIRSDSILLERILINLVSNAIRYTIRGGVIVGCRRRGGTLRIEVRDSGIGIPDHQHSNIFREFHQIPAAERDRNGGLGLGLAIVDRLCRLLDHPIEVASRIDRGSLFALVVPVALTRPLTGQTPQFAIHQVLSKLIMVIDDDPFVRDSMRGLLASWGCTVVTAGSEAAALACLSALTKPPDLIISDYRLPDGANGIQIIERLRQVLCAPVPAFLVSGDTAPELLREVSANGYHLLHKPVLPITLRATVSQLLKSRTDGKGDIGEAVRDASNDLQVATSPTPVPQLQ